jgi:molecular chaperone DnaK (HSP70)
MDTVWIIAAAGAVVLLVIILLLRSRGGERVIDSGGPTADSGVVVAAADASESQPTDPALASGQDFTSAGEVLEVRGKDDAECGLADWLMEDASRALGVDLAKDRLAMVRVAEAALKASADLKSSGQAGVSLPYLVADAGGPKSYQRNVTRQEAELGMVQHGALLVDELVRWRGRDQRTVALAEWLEAAIEEESDSGTGLDPVSTVRVANAAEQAMADVTRSGRAVVDLPGLTREGGGRQDFRAEFDRETLNAMIGED